ncbi:hypothetical protein PPYR_09879 [Photinus pyralis]|uniref:PiggyBac transposable element-derived protein domain-containing protein n=1 Tax=Photinus pyralis TaxID=7054 RepID=A0A5N4AF09_PHOPY|nr:hypothetical protein PPYR_09879 [Photinus pyralis]
MGDCEREQRRLMSLWEDVQNEELDEISSDEGEIDHLSESDHNSETEQEISDEENDTENDVEGVFYTGKDDVTKWFKHPPRPNVRKKISTGVPIFRMTMVLQRFQFLLCCLRFDNYETRQERVALDKLAPIRTIFDAFVTKCRQAYSPSMYVTIDEQLVAFRGKCPFRQYIPILRLIEAITKNGRNVTFDNWFTSYSLMHKLLTEHRITSVGTVRKNKRELPQCLVATAGRLLPSSIFAFQNKITMVSYIEKKQKNVLL